MPRTELRKQKRGGELRWIWGEDRMMKEGGEKRVYGYGIGG